MTDFQPRSVKADLRRRLLWIAALVILLAPLFPQAVKILGEQSELRGRLAESQVALVKHYFGKD